MVFWLLDDWDILDNSKYLLLWKRKFNWFSITILNTINWLHHILFPTNTIAKKSYY